MALELDDETLWAFCDGELPPARALDVIRAERADPALAARISVMREEAETIRAAFDLELDDETPPELERAILDELHAGGGGSAPASTQLPFRRFATPAAAAAAVALAVGAGMLYGNLRLERQVADLAASQAEMRTRLSAAVQDALETRSSGATVSVDGAGLAAAISVTPRKTWKTKSGHWCREFVETLTGPDGRVERTGLACRVDAGRWKRVRTVVEGDPARLDL